MFSKHYPLPASRARLAAVLQAAKEVISVDTVSQTLGIDRRRAGKLLSRWRQQGWLRRIGHGHYVTVPLDLADSEQIVGDPWVLAPTLFGQCYIGGWTAAHHWELTEQLFNETVVFTTGRVIKKHVNVQGAVFLLQHVSPQHFFGLQTVWRESTKVTISDTTRTLIDMIAIPEIGGGIDHVADSLKTYSGSHKYDRDLLIRYAERFGNGAIFKRLGYLAETVLQDPRLAAACRARLTSGYARLDPSLVCHKLATSWRLWIPSRLKEKTS